MGLIVFAAAALAALQESGDAPTVQLPPALETPAPAVDEKPARVIVPPAAVETAAPRRLSDGAAAGPSLAGFVSASIGVVALLGGAVFLLRKYGRNSRLLGGGGPLRILGRRSLGARQEVFLLELGPRILVVGSAREGLRTLSEITNPDEVAVLRAELPGRREESSRAAFRDTLREGLKAAPAPAEEARAVYASIADELADIKKKVHAWKA